MVRRFVHRGRPREPVSLRKKVKRFKHKEVAQEGNLSFPYADGSLKLFAAQWPPKDKNCDDWHPPLCFFLKEDNADQVRIVPSPTSAKMTIRRIPNVSRSQTQSSAPT